MKRCPNCAAEYYDEMLEFCLEDGAKLFTVSKSASAAPTAAKPYEQKPFTEKTFNLPFTVEAQTIESVKPNAARPTTRPTNFPIEKAKSAASQVLETVPVILALAHNWWQWLYAANQSYSSVSGFLISANFLVWLFLLAMGAAVGLLAFKRSENKGGALIALVILSINLILFLVPKR